MKIVKWVSIISTGLLCLILGLSVILYVLKFEQVQVDFMRLGYPKYLVMPLGVLKTIALFVMMTRKWQWAIEWVYAGLTFVFCLAITAHVHVHDGETSAALLALVLVFISYFSWKVVKKV